MGLSTITNGWCFGRLLIVWSPYRTSFSKIKHRHSTKISCSYSLDASNLNAWNPANCLVNTTNTNREFLIPINLRHWLREWLLKLCNILNCSCWWGPSIQKLRRVLYDTYHSWPTYLLTWMYLALKHLLELQPPSTIEVWLLCTINLVCTMSKYLMGITMVCWMYSRWWNWRLLS